MKATAHKRAVVVRHVIFEDLGSFAAPLEERGYAIEYLQAGIDSLDPVAGAHLLAVLGGPISVYEVDRYPILAEELRLLRARLDAGRPTLGICLGAQLMAGALGARVYPGPVKEIGWSPLALTPAGEDSPIKELGGRHTSMFHWHGDTFDLPPGAILLASTSACSNRIFSIGERALAFQCHPEFAAGKLEQWLIGHACELAAAGADLDKMRRESRLYGELLAALGKRAFGRWLDRL